MSTPAVNLNNLKQTPIPVVPMTMKIVNQDGTPTRQGQLLLEQLQKTGAGSGGPSCSLVADIPTGTQDSTNTDFTLANQPVGAMILFLNGVDQQLGVDYTLNQTTITYTTAPNPTDWQVAYYDVCTGGSGAGAFWMAGEGGAIYYNGGAVGIGTSTPQALLDVNGSANFHGNIALGTGGPNSLDLQTTTWNGSAVNTIASNEFWNGSSWVLRNPVDSGWILGMDVTSDGQGGFSINYTPPNSSQVITNFLMAENGNIAIGGNNFNPQYALDVTGSVNVTGDFYVNGVAIAAVAAGFWRAGQPTGSGSIFYSDDNVGIFTNTPQYPLHVVGSIAIGDNAGGSSNRLYLSDFDTNHWIYSTGDGGNATYFGEFDGNFNFQNSDAGNIVMSLTSYPLVRMTLGNYGGSDVLDFQTTSQGGYGINTISANVFWSGSVFQLRNPLYCGWLINLGCASDTTGSISLNYVPPGQNELVTPVTLNEQGFLGVGGNYRPKFALDSGGSIAIEDNVGGSTNRLYLSNADLDHYIYSAGSNGNITYFGEIGANFYWQNSADNTLVMELTGYPQVRLSLGQWDGPSSLDIQATNWQGSAVNVIGSNIYWNGSAWVLRNPGYNGWSFGMDCTSNGTGGVSINYTPPNSGVVITNFYMTESGWIAIGGNNFVPKANLDVSGNVVLGNSNGPGSIDLQATNWKGAYINTIGSNMFWNGAAWQLRNPSYCGWLFGLDAASDGSGGMSINHAPPNSSAVTTYAYMTENGYLSLGPNNFSPQYQLDITGNCNVTGQYLVNGQPMTGFWTAGTPPGAIYYSGGNVGIGVSNPQAVLHVQGGILANPPAGAPTAFEGYCGGVQAFALNTATDGSWGLYDHATGNWVNSITSRGGRIGIGSANPSGRLDVVDLVGTSSAGFNNQLIIREASDNPAYGLCIGFIPPGGIWCGSLQSIANNGASTLLLNPNGGNVGIGTSGPAATLDVNGSGNYNGFVHIGTGGAGQPFSLDIQPFSYGGYAINTICSNIFWNGSAYQQRYSGWNSWVLELNCGGDGQSSFNINHTPPGSNALSQWFTLKENGLLGIDNYNPQFNLDVGGSINCTGAYYRDGVRGAENYFVVPIPGGGTFNVYVNGGIVTGWAENRSARADDPETCDPGDWYTCAPDDRQLVFKMRGKDGVLRRAVLNFE